MIGKGKKKGWLKKLLGILIVLIMVVIVYEIVPYSPTKMEYREYLAKCDEAYRAPGGMKSPRGAISIQNYKDLPQLLKNFYMQNGYDGIQKADKLVYDFRNVKFKMAIDKPAMKLDCQIVNYAKRPTRLGLMQASFHGVPFQGVDSYIEGKGRMKGLLGKMIPVFNVTGPDMDAGGLVTYLAESILHPSLALQERIQYEELDNQRVKALIRDGDLEVEGVIHFDEEGLVSKFTALRYCAETGIYENWVAEMSEYQWSKGINKPTRFRGIWKTGEVDFIYFDSDQMTISYE